MRGWILGTMVAAAMLLPILDGARATEDETETSTERVERAESMTLERLDALILAVDPERLRQPSGRVWTFTVEDVPLTVVTDPRADRMRIVVPVARAGALEPDALMRLMQANFDTALDARYAIGRDVLWSTFIHPLGPLTDDQFLSGIGQTVNLARSFGSTYSSGAVSYGGGDSQDLIARELIEELLKKGRAI